MATFVISIMVGALIGWLAGMIMQTGDLPIQLPNLGVGRQHIRDRLVAVPVRRD
jgi:hypothetical protein